MNNYENKDVLYVSNAPITETQKILECIVLNYVSVAECHYGAFTLIHWLFVGAVRDRERDGSRSRTAPT